MGVVATVVPEKFAFGGGEAIMRAAQIKDGVVVNFVEISSYGEQFGNLYVDPKNSDLGDLYNQQTGDFSKPPEDHLSEA